MPPGAIAFAMEVKDQFRMMKDSLLEKNWIVFSRNLYFFKNGRLGLLGFEFSELLG